jgi:uncharacterized membrane protein HdeD (DUF308 family)
MNTSAPATEAYARFAKRDLDKMSWLAPLVNNRFGDLLNIELRHEQLFFIEGDRVLEDVGYSEKGKRFSEAEYGKPIHSLEDVAKNGYFFVGRAYDPDVMHEALRRQKDGYYYSFFSNQCQDWADRLHRGAERIERERGLGPHAKKHVPLQAAPERPVLPTEPASIWMGCVAIVLGIGGILAPTFAGDAFTAVLGGFFLASGVSHILYAVHSKDWSTLLSAIILAIVNLAAAALLLVGRQFALVTGSLVVAGAVGANGIMHVVGGLFGRPRSHWMGKLFAGLIMLAGVAVVALRWPVSGDRALGVVVGGSLCAGGISTIWLSWRTKLSEQSDQAAA